MQLAEKMSEEFVNDTITSIKYIKKNVIGLVHKMTWSGDAPLESNL